MQILIDSTSHFIKSIVQIKIYEFISFQKGYDNNYYCSNALACVNWEWKKPERHILCENDLV